MADFLDFTPLFQESIDKIRARLNADINAGLAPTDPGYTDLTPGGWAWDLTQSPALEIERLYEALNEWAAAIFPAFAWGTYLDEHGVTINLTRKAAVASAGTVTFTAPNGTLIASGTQVATTQTDPDVAPVVFATTASGTVAGTSIDLPVAALETGSRGNVPAAAINVLESPNPAVTAVTNAIATTGGADVESDELFRDRILLAWAGAHGSGTIADYQQWALAYPGVGYVKVEPLWNGAGTVRVIVTDPLNKPVPSGVVTGLQAELDPVAGQGRGLAPIGAIVTVATVATVTANVSATVALATGYSLDGTGGSIAVRSDIEAAVRDYIDHLNPGDSVILQHVAARFFGVAGVNDVSAVQINGSATNLTLTSLQVATSGSITLS